jgi:hypothetical protein
MKWTTPASLDKNSRAKVVFPAFGPADQEEENSHASEILEPPNGELRQIRGSATLTHFYVTDILRFYETNYPSHY